MADDVKIAELLAESRAAHNEYRGNVPRKVPDGSGTGVVTDAGDRSAARAALQRAYDARLEAEHLDPQGSSPAWADDPHRDVHYALLKFYAEQLA